MAHLSPEVDLFLQTLDLPFRERVDRLRHNILEGNPELEERVKWNAPSFALGPEDRVTFRFAPKGPMQLIFHRGAKSKPIDGFEFVDPTGEMKWPAPDRGVLSLRETLDDDVIVSLIREWIKATR